MKEFTVLLPCLNEADSLAFVIGEAAAEIAQAAHREGLTLKYIIMGDADGSYDFSHLSPFVENLRSGYALVMGNRFRGGIEKGAMPPLHRLGVPALSWLARLRCGAPAGDFHCGLRGFDREAALSLGLQCTGMEFATEIIMAFARSGAKITEVPAKLRCDRRDGKRSHLRTFRDGWRHLKFIMRMK